MEHELEAKASLTPFPPRRARLGRRPKTRKKRTKGKRRERKKKKKKSGAVCDVVSGPRRRLSEVTYRERSAGSETNGVEASSGECSPLALFRSVRQTDRQPDRRGGIRHHRYVIAVVIVSVIIITSLTSAFSSLIVITSSSPSPPSPQLTLSSS